VPVEFSLSSDAPGWNSFEADGVSSTTIGAVCWKCKGSGQTLKKPPAKPKSKGSGKSKSTPKEAASTTYSTPCSVCGGTGNLKPKQKYVKTADKPGRVTSRRPCSASWAPQNKSAFPSASALAFELMPGEELCNLVGDWRILQRSGGHRWTTDDICTAAVAVKQYSLSIGGSRKQNDEHRHIDLGCGNGSVLLMVTWYWMSQFLPQAQHHVGIEARKQAVQFATKSIQYNLPGNENTFVKNRDFREIDEPVKYDLVTGTPPYFAVDFTTNDSKDENKPAKVAAVISQGGMPSCNQSAPARCEFRGGIEAYCEAAAKVMAPTGIFVVCVNWANDKRAYEGAEKSGLRVVQAQRFVGKEGKPPLFVVYTMAFKDASPASATVLPEPVVVRDKDSAWTEYYAQNYLEFFNIPTPK
jgi:tRNA1(Val) A37 N6-methylase TrmN6